MRESRPACVRKYATALGSERKLMCMRVGVLCVKPDECFSHGCNGLGNSCYGMGSFAGLHAQISMSVGTREALSVPSPGPSPREAHSDGLRQDLGVAESRATAPTATTISRISAPMSLLSQTTRAQHHRRKRERDERIARGIALVGAGSGALAWSLPSQEEHRLASGLASAGWSGWSGGYNRVSGGGWSSWRRSENQTVVAAAAAACTRVNGLLRAAAGEVLAHQRACAWQNDLRELDDMHSNAQRAIQSPIDSEELAELATSMAALSLTVDGSTTGSDIVGTEHSIQLVENSARLSRELAKKALSLRGLRRAIEGTDVCLSSRGHSNGDVAGIQKHSVRTSDVQSEPPVTCGDLRDILAVEHPPAGVATLIFGDVVHHVVVLVRHTRMDLQFLLPLHECGFSDNIVTAFSPRSSGTMTSPSDVENSADYVTGELNINVAAVQLPIATMSDVSLIEKRLASFLVPRKAVDYRSVRREGIVHGRLTDELREEVKLELGALSRVLECWYVHCYTTSWYGYTSGGKADQIDNIEGSTYARFSESGLINIYLRGKGGHASRLRHGGVESIILKLNQGMFSTLAEATHAVADIILLGMRVSYDNVLFPSGANRTAAGAAMDTVDGISADAMELNESSTVRGEHEVRAEHLHPNAVKAVELSTACSVWITSVELSRMFEVINCESPDDPTGMPGRQCAGTHPPMASSHIH